MGEKEVVCGAFPVCAAPLWAVSSTSSCSDLAFSPPSVPTRQQAVNPSHRLTHPKNTAALSSGQENFILVVFRSDEA